MDKMLTLAIPTNGIIEWVVPVLNSIYEQSIDEQSFEVIVTDNGNNHDFEKIMYKYNERYSNFLYRKTDAKLFMNQLEAFKLASGEYIKFVNHRSMLKEGTLRYLIEYVKKNKEEKPVTYFLNGLYPIKTPAYEYSKFDTYVYELSYYSSWSGGVGCWKKDLNDVLYQMEKNQTESLYPHIGFVYYYDEERNYYIDNVKLFEELPTEETKKGKYDLFYAFGVEYIGLVKKLLLEKKITMSTYEHVKKENEEFIVMLYLEYVIIKRKCSYDLSTARNSLDQVYSYKKIKKMAWEKLFNRIINKIKKI